MDRFFSGSSSFPQLSQGYALEQALQWFAIVIAVGIVCWILTTGGKRED